MKHIHISELKPGMCVVNPGLDWTSHPYLYMADEVIVSEEAVQKLIEEGYQEVYIDPRHSAHVVPPSASIAADRTIVASAAAPSLKPRVSLEEEMLSASGVHDDSVSYVRSFMRDIRAGKLNMEPAGEIIERITDSLERNADALVSLCRLRRTDSYTYMHCVNVAVLTALFARQEGKDREQVFACALAGLFHDLGKSLVPPMILNAPRKLTNVERTVISEHPQKGYEQLIHVPGIQAEVLLGALHHHEKYNGSGYPQGLPGKDVSNIGFMVGAADIYDALTSRRVYKEAMSPHRALGIMYEMRNIDLPTETLVHFIRMMGVYPTGSIVAMNDGSHGVVTMSNPEQPIKPVVTLVRDPRGKDMKPWRTCDLATHSGGLEVDHCIAPENTEIDPVAVLGLSAQHRGRNVL
jgi:HD-GYP domain-containing protein (c-di-GMP phosphodiesterase class II)